MARKQMSIPSKLELSEDSIAFYLGEALTKKQTADILCCSVTTIYNLIDRGRIVESRLGSVLTRSAFNDAV